MCKNMMKMRFQNYMTNINASTTMQFQKMPLPILLCGYSLNSLQAILLHTHVPDIGNNAIKFWTCDWWWHGIHGGYSCSSTFLKSGTGVNFEFVLLIRFCGL